MLDWRTDLENLSFYLESAVKIMKKEGYGNFVNNEDAIADVARYMMVADNNFDGRGTREGYRYQAANYGMKNFINRNKKKTTTLDSDVPVNSTEVEDNDELEFFLSKVPSIKRQSVIDHYLYGNTFIEIAKRRGVSKQRIEQEVKSSLEDIKCLISKRKKQNQLFLKKK